MQARVVFASARASALLTRIHPRGNSTFSFDALNEGSTPIRAYKRKIVKAARITNTIKTQHFQTDHFEKGPDHRNRLRSEAVYFKKWRFFKYFSEAFVTCERNGLPPPLPAKGPQPAFIELSEENANVQK